MSELTLTHTISRLASWSDNAAESVRSIATELLAFPGIRAVRIQPKGSLFEFVDGPLVWGQLLPDPKQPAVSAKAQIQSGANSWGDLHIYFDLDSVASKSPVQLAQFAAEQLGRIVAAQRLEHQRDELVGQIEYFREQLTLRKSFHRARGLLAEQHGVTELAAGELLRRKAAQSGRPLSEVAEAVINGFERRRMRPGLARKTA